MVQAHAHGDKETMDAFVAKYENKDERRNAMKNIPKNDSFIYAFTLLFSLFIVYSIFSEAFYENTNQTHRKRKGKIQ